MAVQQKIGSLKLFSVISLLAPTPDITAPFSELL